MKYFIVALVVSLAWIHQDWILWPLLSDVQSEHGLVFGIPAGLGFQVTLSFATAAVWFLAVWKAWPTELENWASAGERRSSRGGRGNRDSRGGRSERSGNDNRRDRGRSRSGDSQRSDRSSSERTGEDSGGMRRRRGERGGRGRGRRSGGGGNPNPSSNQ
jgi:hypothetical protein